MKNFTWLLVASMSLIIGGCSGVRVSMDTELGEIVIAVDEKHAPVSAKNFLRYVDEGFYDGGQFHRTVHLDNQPTDEVKIEVIQGSVNREKGRGYGSIPLERTSVTGLLHVDGAISMARGGADTATSSFFICIEDQPELDFGGKRNADGQGFAAFGKVIKGMDVVRKIQKSPAERQNLEPPIGIIKVERVK
ncbi:MAG: peptidylprolyl isomerase [Planctomycetes bacterium]|nr:peptidylprolyl isomerase [Planctomycetota bacterium]